MHIFAMDFITSHKVVILQQALGLRISNTQTTYIFKETAIKPIKNLSQMFHTNNKIHYFVTPMKAFHGFSGRKKNIICHFKSDHVTINTLLNV